MTAMEADAHVLPWFKKPDLNTNKELETLIKDDENLKKYVPDKARVRDLPRSFLSL